MSSCVPRCLGRRGRYGTCKRDLGPPPWSRFSSLGGKYRNGYLQAFDTLVPSRINSGKVLGLTYEVISQEQVRLDDADSVRYLNQFRLHLLYF